MAIVEHGVKKDHSHSLDPFFKTGQSSVIKCLLHKHEDSCLIPRSHVKKILVLVACTWNLSTGGGGVGWRQDDHWHLQWSLIDKLQVNERCCMKGGGWNSWGWLPRLSSSLYAHELMLKHTWTYIKVHIHLCIMKMYLFIKMLKTKSTENIIL